MQLVAQNLEDSLPKTVVVVPLWKEKVVVPLRGGNKQDGERGSGAAGGVVGAGIVTKVGQLEDPSMHACMHNTKHQRAGEGSQRKPFGAAACKEHVVGETSGLSYSPWRFHILKNEFRRK